MCAFLERRGSRLEESEIEKLLDIDDLDKPIYRIFPQWALAEALRLKELTLVPPHFWEDPYEIIERKIAVTVMDGDIARPQIILGGGLTPIFAQSWSSTAESDTLLRAYSRVVKHPHHGRNTCPGEEGVKVRTTPRKLIRAVLDGTNGTDASPFIGDVLYLSTEELHSCLSGLIATAGPHVFDDSANRIRLLMLKRDGFSHEREVRVGVIAPQPKGSSVFKVKIDPNSIFEEITFDPRLIEFERKERIRDFEELGFTGTFGESNLYQSVILDIRVRVEGT